MPDHTNKMDPLELRDQRPPYVSDRSGAERANDDEPPVVGGDPTEAPDTSQRKPSVSLDREAVRRAEEEGRGF